MQCKECGVKIDGFDYIMFRMCSKCSTEWINETYYKIKTPLIKRVWRYLMGKIK